MGKWMFDRCRALALLAALVIGCLCIPALAETALTEDAESVEVDAAYEEAAPEPDAEGEADAPDEAGSGSVILTVTAVGDCTFGGEVGSKANKRFEKCVKDNGYDYFFDNVRHLFENDDLTIVNLEGPLTSSSKTKAHGYVFKADPECVNILTGSSVELCNVANNHSLDYGEKGLKDTAEVLEQNGVGYCGFNKVWNATIKGVRVTALGFTKWDNTVEEVYQAVAEARESCDLLIVNMHWGWEGHREQDAKQTSLGHAIVNAGADLVIGTHPHVYEGIEKYKGKYIVYSLGNFCFAGNANPGDKRCLIFQQSFSFNPGLGIERANIMDAGINIIPCTVSSVKDKNDFQPTIMPAQEGGELLKAVASRSVNFSLTNTLWAADNYMLAYGLVTPGDEAQDAPVTADVDAAEEEVVEETETGEELPETETI